MTDEKVRTGGSGNVGTISVNKVLGTIPRSGIRRITDQILELGQAGAHIIHLGLGQPQEPTSKIICRAVAEAALAGHTKYTLNAGLLELRTALQQKLQRFNKARVGINDIFITPGATYGVTVAIGSLINPGDEVLVPDPGYPNYASAVLHYGGVVKYYSLDPREGFQLNVEAVANLFSEQTRMVVINSPSNPTGAVFAKEQIERLVELTGRHGVWLLSDEVYEAYVFAGEHVSPLAFANASHVVGIYSFSKTYNMTGLRVGYVVTHNHHLHPIFINAQELYASCAPSVSQVAALHALRYCDSYVEELGRGFLEKRNIALRALGGLVSYIPQGAFYLLVDISRTHLTSDHFADQLLQEKQVAVAPGATFGPSADRYIRIALTAPKELLETGVRKIREFIKER